MLGDVPTTLLHRYCIWAAPGRWQKSGFGSLLLRRSQFKITLRYNKIQSLKLLFSLPGNIMWILWLILQAFQGGRLPKPHYPFTLRDALAYQHTDAVHAKALQNATWCWQPSHLTSKAISFLSSTYLLKIWPQNLYWARFRKLPPVHFFQTPCLCCYLCCLQLSS